MELIKKIFSRINARWRRAQEESMHEEYKLLADVWNEHKTERWESFKRDNAVVNSYFNRTA